MALNTTAGTMQAVVWNGDPYSVSVETRPIPNLVNDTDAIVKLSSAGICGTDLHVYHGIYGSTEPGWILGHEGVGYISAIGDGVHYHDVGDYVVVPDNFGHGYYPELEPVIGQTPGYGPDYTNGQDVGGCQAEYVRVPFADRTLIPIPKTDGAWNTSKELDYVMTSDIFATAWAGLTWSGFEAGDTVAVFGAGPVGQMAVYSALIRGASRVYVVDRYESRLNLAESIGAIPINYNTSDPVQQILAYEPSGVARTVDAVGYEAELSNGTRQEDLVLRQALEATRFLGGIGVVGVYDVRGNASGRPLAGELPQNIPFNASLAFSQGIRFQIGAVDAREFAPYLIDLISSGKATPSYIVSSKINITQAPEYYRRFSARDETKVIIQFD